jgi:hypothetical protein
MHVQEIHTKLVKNPRRLVDVLQSVYGPNKFEVEMRHNMYSVRTNSPIELDLDRLATSCGPLEKKSRSNRVLVRP